MNDAIDPILRRRHWVVVILRSAAIVFLIIAVYSMAYPVMRSVQIGQGLQGIGALYGQRSHAHWGTAIGTLIPGLVFLLFSHPIAKWIVPAIRNECPACGYALGEHTAERCPECGHRLRARQSADPDRDSAEKKADRSS